MPGRATGRGTLATGVPGCFISRQKQLCNPNAQKLFSLLHSGLLMNNPPSSFKDVLFNCFSYKMGKSKILLFPAHRTITTSCFGLIHINVWEISPTISHSHHKYFFTFTTDYSKFVCIYFTHAKSEVFDAFKKILVLTKILFSNSISIFHSEWGGGGVGGERVSFLDKLVLRLLSKIGGRKKK